MGGLATGIITLAIGLAKHIPNEKHLILVQEDNQNSSFEEEYDLPKNLLVLKLKKFGPKMYPIALEFKRFMEANQFRGLLLEKKQSI